MSEQDGGVVAVTRFSGASRLQKLALLLLHHRIAREVSRLCPGFIGASHLTNWAGGAFFSITMWRDLDSVYGMGEVTRHIRATRLPIKMGLRTRCGVFAYEGDWKTVMFGAAVETTSPLSDEYSA